MKKFLQYSCICSLAVVVAMGGRIGRADIVTSFDTGEGFVVGSIVDGQNGWTQFVASAAQPTVSDTNPFSGDAHLNISDDPAIGDGTLTGGFSPLDPDGLPSSTPSLFSVMLYIDDILGADYDVVGQTPNEGFLTYRVKFNFQGNIFILDDPDATLQFVDTGVAWDQQSYSQLMVDLDPSTSTIEYFYNGNLIYTGNMFAGTTVEQVICLSDNFQGAATNPGAFGDFDDINLIQNPMKQMGCDFEIGDINQDGIISLLDVSPFVNILTSSGFQCEADINEDGAVTLTDVAPFVAILTGG